MRLLRFEIGQWLKNPLLYVVMLIIAFFLGSQLGDGFWTETFTWPEPPVPGLPVSEAEPSYGFISDTSEEAKMASMNRMLYFAANENPVSMPALGGFINRQVRLSSEQVELVRQAFKDVTGKEFLDVSHQGDMPSSLPYAEYEARITALNDALGDQYFRLSSIYGTNYVPMTYEQAVADYEKLIKEDQYTRAQARMYADYAGIALGLFPAFLAAFMMGRDKRSGADAVIGVRPISSVRYLMCKYLGLALPLCAFVMLAALIPTAGAILMRSQGHPVDVWAYIGISVGWLLPTVLIVTAVALFISQAAGTGIAAIPVAVALWMVSVARPGLAGPYPLWAQLIRYNNMNPFPAEWAAQVLANRLVMVAASVGLVALAGLIHGHRRAHGGGYV